MTRAELRQSTLQVPKSIFVLSHLFVSFLFIPWFDNLWTEIEIFPSITGHGMNFSLFLLGCFSSQSEFGDNSIVVQQATAYNSGIPHWSAGSYPSCPFPIQVPPNVPGKAAHADLHTRAFAPMNGAPGCSHLESKRYLSSDPSLCLCLSNKWLCSLNFHFLKRQWEREWGKQRFFSFCFTLEIVSDCQPWARSKPGTQKPNWAIVWMTLKMQTQCEWFSPLIFYMPWELNYYNFILKANFSPLWKILMNRTVKCYVQNIKTSL